MDRIRTACAALGRWGWFISTGLALIAGPWLFGSWEMWWFWGMCLLLALGLLMAGLALAADPGESHSRLGQEARLALLCALPFLLYAALRAFFSPVVLDAERSILLILLPAAIALTSAWLTSPLQRRLLQAALLLNILLVAAYGLINHLITGSQRILWAPGYPQYFSEGRVSAPFFCPDHYAGLLELGLCGLLALLLLRKTPGLVRAGAGVGTLLVLVGIVASKSRGGMLTLLVIGVAALCWGFAQWPPRIRWSWRALVVSLMLLGVAISLPFSAGTLTRFTAYPPVRAALHGNFEGIHEAAQHTSRYHMYSAAWRSWRATPVLGIGAGMHQHRWPQFAASPDGNRETGKWPTFHNAGFFSYKVHSDWLQLLQEYGIVGLLLMLLALGGLFLSLSRRLKAAIGESAPWDEPLAPLTALLAVAALTFHSFGDFNLQIPAIGWVLAALVGLGLETERRRGAEHA